MRRQEDLLLLISGILLTLVTLLVVTLESQFANPSPTAESMTAAGLLTDPFLQLPTADSVHVVWFTEFEGQQHTVIYGRRPAASLEPGNLRQVFATTKQLTRLHEDQASRLPTGTTFETPTFRSVWRHDAEVTGLVAGQRLPYQVKSLRADGTIFASDVFSLAAAPPAGQPLKILLTSDHQSKPMTAANLQKVKETVGEVDAQRSAIF
ncbi:MAG: hypothetical protein AAGA01_05645 [Cyanobacteria bacterium P01_E01_bin.43]